MLKMIALGIGLMTESDKLYAWIPCLSNPKLPRPESCQREGRRDHQKVSIRSVTSQAAKGLWFYVLQTRIMVSLHYPIVAPCEPTDEPFKPRRCPN
jgi:hypothetical protein